MDQQAPHYLLLETRVFSTKSVSVQLGIANNNPGLGSLLLPLGPAACDAHNLDDASL